MIDVEDLEARSSFLPGPSDRSPTRTPSGWPDRFAYLGYQDEYTWSNESIASPRLDVKDVVSRRDRRVTATRSGGEPRAHRHHRRRRRRRDRAARAISGLLTQPPSVSLVPHSHTCASAHRLGGELGPARQQFCFVRELTPLEREPWRSPLIKDLRRRALARRRPRWTTRMTRQIAERPRARPQHTPTRSGTPRVLLAGDGDRTRPVRRRLRRGRRTPATGRTGGRVRRGAPERISRQLSAHVIALDQSARIRAHSRSRSRGNHRRRCGAAVSRWKLRRAVAAWMLYHASDLDRPSWSSAECYGQTDASSQRRAAHLAGGVGARREIGAPPADLRSRRRRRSPPTLQPRRARMSSDRHAPRPRAASELRRHSSAGCPISADLDGPLVASRRLAVFVCAP